VTAATYLLLFGVLAPPPQEKPPEPLVRVSLLDNGSFAERNDSAVDRHGMRPIPWWLSSNGMEQVVAVPGGGFALRTKGGEWAEQPFAVFAPLARMFTVRGHVSGKGRVVVLGGDGKAHERVVGGADPSEFEVENGWYDLEIDSGPRFTLRLEGTNAGESTLWSNLSVEADTPCPSEKDLRAEILALLQEIVAPWLERGVDDLGPKKTSLLCHTFDAISGKTLTTSPGGLHPLWEQLNAALQVAEVPEWRAAFERFLDDWLTLCLDPTTGLPRSWDCEKDEPIVDRPAGDLALPLGFLIDVAEKGPERVRDHARAAAAKIAETVLATGVLPDGTIGASYFPADGRANTSVAELRRFDLLAQLARLPQLRSDPRFVRASEELRSAFEFSHVWWGTWDRIDPGFDDEFGNYGARAAAIALADPDGREGKAFRAIALDGWRHYAPIWSDALRLGGNVAADQVRCWNLLGDLVKVEPSQKDTIAELLHLAARSHFKGEQYGNGAWGDVTIFRFGPRTGLQVGDYPGTPQNLLNGLATIYSDDLGGRTEEVRAMYTSVLRSSVKEYRREFGFLLDRTQREGDNPATGTLRMLLGLVKMLRTL
jgi:hypothetical protein